MKLLLLFLVLAASVFVATGVTAAPHLEATAISTAATDSSKAVLGVVVAQTKPEEEEEEEEEELGEDDC